MRRYPTLVLLAVIGFLAVTARAEKLENLKPTGYLNDFADVLSANTRRDITNLCSQLDSKTSAQVAVVTIQSLDGLTVEDFAERLFRAWGIGSKSNNRGVLILLAVKDRKYRVEVGYSLEPLLPDGKVGSFAREMVPFLRRQDYDGAVLGLTERIASEIAADQKLKLEYEFKHSRRSAPVLPKLINGFLLLGFLLLVIGGPLWMLIHVLVSSTGPHGYYRSGRKPSNRSNNWWLGGGSSGGSSWGGGGGFGGSGGGFGGFGGGSSGGGGASGSW